MDTEKINYYYVPADKIGHVLCHLNSYGWLWDDNSPIERYYISATSHDFWSEKNKCVFKVEQWKGQKEYKFIAITSDILLKEKGIKIYSYDDFKKRVGSDL